MPVSAAAGAQGAGQWRALPAVAPAPTDHPTTPAKVRLGKMLFFDPRLSSTGTVSCFSCHNIMEGGDDHRPVSIGVEAQRGGRNAPTVFNAAFLSVQFWDGRAATLEDQDKGPPVNAIEMGMKGLTEVISRIRLIPGYRPYFEQALGSGDAVTMDNASKAIAAYERTLIIPGSGYDRYVRGDHSQRSGIRSAHVAGRIMTSATAVADRPNGLRTGRQAGQLTYASIAAHTIEVRKGASSRFWQAFLGCEARSASGLSTQLQVTAGAAGRLLKSRKERIRAEGRVHTHFPTGRSLRSGR